MADGKPREGYKFIFVPSYWHWGLMRRLYAREYGYQVFRLEVRINGPRRIPPDRVPGQAHARPHAPVPRRPVKRTPRPKKR